MYDIFNNYILLFMIINIFKYIKLYLNIFMERKLISINSIFRDKILYPNPGKFSIILDEPFKNITSIRLASFELPTVYHTFHCHNNTEFMIILKKTDNSLIDIPINICHGNYTYTDILNEINSHFSSINIQYNSNFVISFNNISYTTTITNTTPFSLIFNNHSFQKNLGYRLGFRKDNESYLYNNQNSHGTNPIKYSWTGESILDITKDAYMYVKINNYGIIYDNNVKNDLLAKIILYDQQFVIDNGANFLTKEYIFRQPVNISKFDIELISYDGNIIDTNLVDYSLTLELLQIYDNNKFNDYNFNVF